MPGCIPCKTHAGVTPVAHHVYATLEGWRTPEVRRSKEPCAEIAVLLHQYAKEYRLGYIHAATPTRKLTPRRRSSGLSAWNAPWMKWKTKTPKWICYTVLPQLPSFALPPPIAHFCVFGKTRCSKHPIWSLPSPLSIASGTLASVIGIRLIMHYCRINERLEATIVSICS